MEKILIIGSANVDLVLHTDRMPRLGETLIASGLVTNAGGKGLNQAVAVKKLGGDAAFLGCLGTDAHGNLLLDAMEQYHLPFVGTRTAACPTGLAEVNVVQGDNFILVSSGANAALTPELIDAQAQRIREADYLIMQLEIPLETVVRAAEIAHAAGTRVILNPAPCRDLPQALYPLIDYLIPNEHEAQLLTGIAPTEEASCQAAMNCLLQRGVKTVIITLGEAGCCYAQAGKIGFHPAVKTEAVDTTSAGDTFIGGLCSRLSLGDGLEEAISYAVRAAAITVSRSGAAVSIPYAEEIR